MADPLARLDRLVRANALNDALREGLATKAEISALKADIVAVRTALVAKIELAVRAMTIRTGMMLIALFGALTAIKFFS